MTTLPIYQLDAFTSRLFAGNPAAVVLLEAWLPDGVMSGQSSPITTSTLPNALSCPTRPTASAVCSSG